jgi:hypothetical protein
MLQSGSRPIETLLARLDGVQRRGEGRWYARCPAHDDRRPSLGVSEVADGTVLVHCYAACSPADVLAALGLSLRDLFPHPQRHEHQHRGRHRPALSARDVLVLLDHETLLIEAVAADIAAGRPVVAADVERVAVARRRLARVREVVG